MADVGEPELLIKGHADPHSYSMRPSDARLLKRAELIFRISPELEFYLNKPIKSLDVQKSLINLIDAKNIIRLKARRGGLVDPHIWLNPKNGIHMVRHMAKELSRIDPANRNIYERNREGVINRIKSSANALILDLAPLRDTPYMIVHDAFQYFENFFRLSPRGILSSGDGHRPGAKSVSELRRSIIALAPAQVCVFHEPQAPKSLARVLGAGINAKIVTLDPLGSDLKPGRELYINLLTNIAQNMKTCILTR